MKAITSSALLESQVTTQVFILEFKINVVSIVVVANQQNSQGNLTKFVCSSGAGQEPNEPECT